MKILPDGPAFERADILNALDLGWGYVVVSGHPEPMPLITIAGKFVTVRHSLYGRLTVPISRVTDMCQAVPA